MASPLFWSYLVYLVASLMLIVWVARTLYTNGAVFLRDVFAGNEDLALAVNRLLLVGFYLVTIGFVLLTSSLGADTVVTADRYQALTVKLGAVALILGLMHFLNLSALTRARQSRLDEGQHPGVWGASASAAPAGPAAPVVQH